MVLKLTNITVGDISHHMDMQLSALKIFYLKNVYFGCHEHLEKLLLIRMSYSRGFGNEK
jgi:hypothetical protein